MTTTVLITGANRGLGQGLLKLFLQKPNHTIIAAVRSPDHPTAQALPTLPRDPTTHLIITPYDASLGSSAQTAVQNLTRTHGITHLDIVVANAGIAKSYPLVKDVQLPEIREHVETNVLSVVALYQATRDLLEKSTSTSTSKPVFAIMGSGAGALGRQPPVPSAVYGASKAMVNWYGVRINAEDAWLNAFVLDPGWVQTDMGNAAAQGWGMEAAPTSVEESVGGMVEVLTTGTKERVGGKVVLYTGEVQQW